MNRRLIIVSNRLPITFDKAGGTWRSKPSSGGLVTALEPVLATAEGIWIGWTGTSHDAELEHAVRTSPTRFPLEPVFLTDDEKHCFYHGCANEILWPLFHDLQSRCNFDPTYWAVYRKVNDKFADAVEQHATGEDLVWVHDYHLMLVAERLAARNKRRRVAYFHHIPFPPPDIFEKLPWGEAVLQAMLRFELIGFQNTRDRRNFIACVRHLLQGPRVRKVHGRCVNVIAGDMSTTVGTFPISIDFAEFAVPAALPSIAQRATDLRTQARGAKVVLGVDRLDYTKGIPERLAAFRHLFNMRPDLLGRVTLFQIVVPSREDIGNYADLKLRIERLVSEINGEIGMPGWTPVVYMHRSIDRRELLAYYRAADVALVTPLKDGMNLVAKEFCAARVDRAGVLVLSKFAGAAEELAKGALLVNPYDTEGVATVLCRALAMSGAEQRSRMDRLRAAIATNDVHKWAESFCRNAASPPRSLMHEMQSVLAARAIA